MKLKYHGLCQESGVIVKPIFLIISDFVTVWKLWPTLPDINSLFV